MAGPASVGGHGDSPRARRGRTGGLPPLDEPLDEVPPLRGSLPQGIADPADAGLLDRWLNVAVHWG